MILGKRVRTVIRLSRLLRMDRLTHDIIDPRVCSSSYSLSCRWLCLCCGWSCNLFALESHLGPFMTWDVIYVRLTFGVPRDVHFNLVTLAPMMFVRPQDASAC